MLRNILGQERKNFGKKPRTQGGEELAARKIPLRTKGSRILWGDGGFRKTKNRWHSWGQTRQKVIQRKLGVAA